MCQFILKRLIAAREEKAETLMTRIRVRIRVVSKNEDPARLRTCHGKSTTANVCDDFLKRKMLLEKFRCGARTICTDLHS